MCYFVYRGKYAHYGRYYYFIIIYFVYSSGVCVSRNKFDGMKWKKLLPINLRAEME